MRMMLALPVALALACSPHTAGAFEPFAVRKPAVRLERQQAPALDAPFLLGKPRRPCVLDPATNTYKCPRTGTTPGGCGGSGVCTPGNNDEPETKPFEKVLPAELSRQLERGAAVRR